jgi:hypothetical protein
MMALANCRPGNRQNSVVPKRAAQWHLPLVEDDSDGRRAGDGSGAVLESDNEGRAVVAGNVAYGFLALMAPTRSEKLSR